MAMDTGREVEAAWLMMPTLCRTFQKSQGVQNGEWGMKKIFKPDTKRCLRQVSPRSLRLARDVGQCRNVTNQREEGRRAEVHPGAGE